MIQKVIKCYEKIIGVRFFNWLMSMPKEFIAHIRAIDGSEQSLESHLSQVGDLSAEFATKIQLEEAGRLIGLMHDFGKYSKQFQRYIQSAEGKLNPDQDEYIDAGRYRGQIDHSSAGAQYVWKELKKFGSMGQGNLCGQILALCIASHHSGLINCIDEHGNPTFCKRMEKIDEKTHFKECRLNADAKLKQRVDEIMSSAFVKEMFGKLRNFVNLPKFPDEEYIKTDAFALGMLVRFLFSCLVDADRIDSAEFEFPIRKEARESQRKWLDWSRATVRLDSHLKNLKKEESANYVDILRSRISDYCYNRASDQQGVYTLSVPTGGGKTLSSLRYALRHAQLNKLDRIVYVIPYTSIIEQNADAVRKILEIESDDFPWVLEHHCNVESTNLTWRTKLASENWDAPIVFTTMVQFLEALFSGGTRSVRRLHQLANAVLIFDEIQTLPIRCVHMFCNALNFLTQHARTTVVLCTATQPLLDKLPSSQYGELRLAPNSELISEDIEIFKKLRRVEFVFNQTRNCNDKWSVGNVAELALEKFNESGSCLVVVNTKRWAREVYRACRTHCDADSIFHLSTNQYPIHRKSLISLIRQQLNDGKPVLCISTQLIEAGVDISFASVIRLLAGLDSIAQAGGRCNRNAELTDDNGFRKRGIVEVVTPENDSLARMTDIRVGAFNAERIFREFGSDNILSPDVMERYFKYFFFDRSEEMVYPHRGGDRDDNLINLLSTNPRNVGGNHSCLNPQQKLKLLKQSFMDAGNAFAAIDAPTESVIVQHEGGEEVVNQLCSLAKNFDPYMYYKALKNSQQYSINVYSEELVRLREQKAVHEVQPGEGIFYLNKQYYSEEFGLSAEPKVTMEFHAV